MKRLLRFSALPLLLLLTVPSVTVTGCDRLPFIKQQSADEKLIQELREMAEYNLYDDRVDQKWYSMGASAVPKLLPLLQEKDPQVQAYAAYILGEIGEPAHSAAPHLMSLLKDPENNRAQAQAAKTLGKMGKAAQPAIDMMIKDYQSPDNAVSFNAAHVLGLMAPATQSSISTLLDIGASGALSAIGEPAIPDLLKALKNPKHRSTAFNALKLMGKTAKSTAPEILPYLKDANPQVRVAAASALASMGEASAQILPVLMAALKDTDHAVQRGAVEDLGKMNQAAKPAIPALLVILKDPNPRLDSWLRTEAANALGRMGEIEILLAALKDKNPLVRWRAAHALGKMGQDGKVAKPALEEALKDSDKFVQRQAKEALKRLNYSNHYNAEF